MGICAGDKDRFVGLNFHRFKPMKFSREDFTFKTIIQSLCMCLNKYSRITVLFENCEDLVQRIFTHSLEDVLMYCIAVTEEESPIQSHKTSPSTSPSSSVYGGTASNPSRPPSESTDGPFKKRSKPAVILRKVKKSLASTITENVSMREGTSSGRPVAMVKGLISSLTGSMSQSNVPMTTVDIMESTAEGVAVNENGSCDSGDVIINDVTEKPTILSAVASHLSEQTLATR